MAEKEAAAGERPAAGAPSDGHAAGDGDGRASVLFVGDVVGGIGRRTLLDSLPPLRERYPPTFVIVNGENVAGGGRAPPQPRAAPLPPGHRPAPPGKPPPPPPRNDPRPP